MKNPGKHILAGAALIIPGTASKAWFYQVDSYQTLDTSEKKISGKGVEFIFNGSYTFMGSSLIQPKIEDYSKTGELYDPHSFSMPKNLPSGENVLTAILSYRRMPDPLADFLKVERRPVIEVSRDAMTLTIQ